MTLHLTDGQVAEVARAFGAARTDDMGRWMLDAADLAADMFGDPIDEDSFYRLCEAVSA